VAGGFVFAARIAKTGNERDGHNSKNIRQNPAAVKQRGGGEKKQELLLGGSSRFGPGGRSSGLGTSRGRGGFRPGSGSGSPGGSALGGSSTGSRRSGARCGGGSADP
jgi:hypothetical protein